MYFRFLFSSSCNNDGETKPLTWRPQPRIPVGRGLAAFRGNHRNTVSGSVVQYDTRALRMEPNVGTSGMRDRRASLVTTDLSNSNADRLHAYQQVTLGGATVVDRRRLAYDATIPRPQRQLPRVISRDTLLPKHLQCT